MAVGADYNLIRIEVEGIGPDLIAFPCRIVHIQYRGTGIVVYGVIKAGVCRRRVGVAGSPYKDLGILGQDIFDFLRRGREITGFIFTVIRQDSPFQWGMAENEGRLIPVCFEFRFEPGQFRFRQLHCIGLVIDNMPFDFIGRQEEKQVVSHVLRIIKGPIVGLVFSDMFHPFIGVCGLQFSLHRRCLTVHHFMISGNECLRLGHFVRELPGQTVLVIPGGKLHHIPREDTEIHILPAVDILHRLFFVRHDPCSFGQVLMLLAAVVDITHHHQAFIILRPHRGRRKAQGAQGGCQQDSSSQGNHFLFQHSRFTLLTMNIGIISL